MPRDDEHPEDRDRPRPSVGPNRESTRSGRNGKLTRSGTGHAEPHLRAG